MTALNMANIFKVNCAYTVGKEFVGFIHAVYK
jgi:hypothetical protein